jgi:hypothetical protein
MKPHEVGFDGAEGLRIRVNGNPDCKFLLRRGAEPPKVGAEFKNELLWYYPEDQEPKALYADHHGRFYELDFRPIDNPFETND